MTKIIVDAMGGDNAPYSVVAGAVQALEADKRLYLILTGRENAVKAELKKYKYDNSRIEIIDCPDVIGMDEIPTEAVKRKQSSMMQAFWMLKKQDDIAAMVTAGSTGAAIVGGQLILGRIPGVKRPALCPAIPNSRGGFTLLIDCGANAECKPVMLCQFALLGSAYAKCGFGIENPKVGLLNNGTEDHKGDSLRLETFPHLKDLKGINFLGNVEGRDIMIGEVDVVVADGYTGNIALKSIEGCGKLILNSLKEELSSSVRTKIGYLFIKKAIKRMRSKLDFDKFGGALLLGLKKPVVKSHGSSKPETIKNSILNAAKIHARGLVPSVEELLKDVDFNAFTEGNL